MAKFEGYKDIYVFVEQKNGEVANVGYELISEARKLVASIPQMNFQVVGVLLGHNIKDKANDVIDSWNPKEYMETPLAAPTNVNLSGNTLTWDAVDRKSVV